MNNQLPQGMILNSAPQASTNSLPTGMVLNQPASTSVQPQNNPPSYQNEIAQQQVEGAQKIGSSIDNPAMNRAFNNTNDNPLQRAGNAVLGAAEAGFGTISGAAQIAFAPATPVISKLYNFANSQLAKSNPKLSQGLSPVSNQLNDLATKYPEATGLVSDIANTLLIAFGGAEAKPVTRALEEGVSDAALNLKNVIKAPAKTADQIIAENISPPANAKEIKLAQSEGRIVKGSNPTLLRGGTPDKILTSDKVYNATQVIKREIPDAETLSQPDLYTALEARTTDMAQKLQPEMKAVKLDSPRVEKIQSEWESLKQKQIDNAYKTEEPNVLKVQKQMDSMLTKIKKGTTLDDVWTMRKTLDEKTPTNVKNANHLSDSRLQERRELWLQNRSILNDVINDSDSGLGSKSKNAFSDMKAMYDAKVNLLSTAKSNFEASSQPSIISQWMKDHPYITGGIIGGATAATGIPGHLIKSATGL